MPSLTRDEFVDLARHHRAGDAARTLAIPLGVRLLADQLTPVLAYRRLVSADVRNAPSFLLESVEGGERQGRYSLLGSAPSLQVTAYGNKVEIRSERGTERRTSANPLAILREISGGISMVEPAADRDLAGLPDFFLGGWAGYAGYDTVRYIEPDKLASPPTDDRHLPDLDFAFYDGAVVFDTVKKLVFVVRLAMLDPGDDPGAAHDRATQQIEAVCAQIQSHSKPLPLGRVTDEPDAPAPMQSNTTRAEFEASVERIIEYIRAGDIFQAVIGQRFERRSTVDPFDVYRALRAVNPSPYMGYMQTSRCILVAASPEILCRVRTSDTGQRIVTNRPLAGTRKRGETPEADLANEADLLADPKERAEHAMLVDLARNDVGRVAEPGSIRVGPIMEIERYSHVMHISSTVTGTLRTGLDGWDALHAALPVGTVSGAPKIRAMQILDELEPVKRGPYGGGFGTVGLDGDMDIALALRTIVVPTADWIPDANSHTWHYHIQAGAGVVLDSVPANEFDETVNKASALARAIDLAECAFGTSVSS